MKMFVIDNAGKISAVQPESVTEGQTTFTTDKRIGSDHFRMAQWKAGRDLEPTTRSHSSSQVYGPQVCRCADLEGRSDPGACCCAQAAQRPRRRCASGRKAKTEEGAPKANKTATVLDLLRREGGATLDDIMSATGWQAHSVRGFISGVLGKRMGLTVESAKREDGKRTYSVAS